MARKTVFSVFFPLSLILLLASIVVGFPERASGRRTQAGRSFQESLFFDFLPVASTSPEVAPYFWEIKILVQSKGEYRVDEEEKFHRGHYSFVLIWTGCMEQDMDDYIIYHENSELVEWEAREEDSSSPGVQVIPGKDYAEKPCFDFHYILRRGKNLHFDFQVDGFSVPQGNTDEKFDLVLPSSQENTENASRLSYNAHLVEGSNDIHIEEEEIYHSAVEKTYGWKWKHRQLRDRKKHISLFQSHDVEVVLTIIPHYLPR